MKTIYAILISRLLLMSESWAQDTPVTIYTPKGSSVTAYNMVQESNTDRQALDNYYATAYPGNTQIKTGSPPLSSSRKYNCHGYAWNIVEGGAEYWIGYAYTTDEDIYMSDGSYVQTCSETYPGKVSWGSGDHTAVTTSTPGVYISKWNKFPLMQHAWNNTPYGTTNLKYYASTKISGSTETLCTGSRSFSVENIPGATYSWTKSSGITVVGSSNSYQYTVQRNGSANEVAWVEVEISTSCSSTSSTRRVYFNVGAVPSPSVYADWDNPLKIIVGAYEVTGATSYKWYVNNVYIKSTTYVNTSLPYNGDCYTNVIVGVEVVNVCGTSEKINTNIGTAPCDNFYSIAPNPAQDMITITTGEQTNISAISGASSSSENSIEQIKIYNNNQVVVKSVEYNEKRKQVQVNVSDIAEGLYFIEISNGKNRQIKKLLITR